MIRSAIMLCTGFAVGWYLGMLLDGWRARRPIMQRAPLLPGWVDTPFVQLHTGHPGPSGTENISDGSAERRPIAWDTVRGNIVTRRPVWENRSWSAPEVISYVSLWSTSEDGEFYQPFRLAVSQAWMPGDTFTIPVFQLTGVAQ